MVEYTVRTLECFFVMKNPMVFDTTGFENKQMILNFNCIAPIDYS